METITTEHLNIEDHSQAMNFIGQNLFSALVQSMEKLPAQYRNQKMVCNALSGFLVNIIYKQTSGNKEASQEMFDELSKLVQVHLESIPK